jgi:hypothetical protein
MERSPNTRVSSSSSRGYHFGSVKLLLGPWGTFCYVAASVPWLTVILLDRTGWPFYAASAVWFVVALPIAFVRQRAKKDASERTSASN